MISAMLPSMLVCLLLAVGAAFFFWKAYFLLERREKLAAGVFALVGWAIFPMVPIIRVWII